MQRQGKPWDPIGTSNPPPLYLNLYQYFVSLMMAMKAETCRLLN